MEKKCLLGLFVAILLTACSGEKKASNRRPTAASVGLPSEVVLVLDDAILRSDLKDSLEELLTCNVPGLNQGEDYFRLSRIPVSMDQKDFLKMHSRVLAKVDSKLKEPTLGIARDVKASPQLQVQLAGPSEASLRPFISSHAEQVRQLILDNQLSIQAQYLKQHASQEVAKDLKELLGYSIYAPEEIRYTKKGKDFLWASSRTNEKQLNLVVYTLPFSGQDITDPRVLATIRDSVMAVNIPGSEPDQWMETVWESDRPIVLAKQRALSQVLPLLSSETDTTESFATDFRGLWQMRNGAMGGPFVSLVFVDIDTSRLVVAEGFVFSPQTTKRDLVRRLEAALRTLHK